MALSKRAVLQYYRIDCLAKGTIKR